jgi:3-oxoadipate enol-lactonase
VPDQQGYAPAAGTALYYEVSGAGPPVVLVHGFSLDHRMWDPQVGALSRRHTVVRYDLRGFGKSAAGTVSYTHADDLDALFAHLKLERAALVGLSLGGGATINFAITRAEKVSALIVVDPSLGGFKWSPEFTASQASIRATAKQKGMDAARAEWLGDPIFQPAFANAVTGAQLRSIVRDYSGSHWTTPDRGRPFSPPAIERLKEVRAPTLIIVGELDNADFQRIASTLAQGIPGAQKVVLSGVGHMANLEDPARFNGVVLGFLAKAEASSG